MAHDEKVGEAVDALRGVLKEPTFNVIVHRDSLLFVLSELDRLRVKVAHLEVGEVMAEANRLRSAPLFTEADAQIVNDELGRAYRKRVPPHACLIAGCRLCAAYGRLRNYAASHISDYIAGQKERKGCD